MWPLITLLMSCKKEEPYCLEYDKEKQVVKEKECQDGYKLNDECNCIETKWRKILRGIGESDLNNVNPKYK